jgi:hypothetical protein
VLEIALYVDDLARDGRFYAEVGCSLFEDERLRAFAGGECRREHPPPSLKRATRP